MWVKAAWHNPHSSPGNHTDSLQEYREFVTLILWLSVFLEQGWAPWSHCIKGGTRNHFKVHSQDRSRLWTSVKRFLPASSSDLQQACPPANRDWLSGVCILPLTISHAFQTVKCLQELVKIHTSIEQLRGEVCVLISNKLQDERLTT